MERACSINEEKRNAYRILVVKPERPLGRPRHRWMDNIKMDIKRGSRMGSYGLD
jgi:hypothetical protein